ncbi:MAG TPA: hypothetical protein VGQ33_00750, partial [Vicinamibacteria bacterium]|nr:hypothetical protein [Vicinamibacteria bacterium]
MNAAALTGLAALSSAAEPSPSPPAPPEITIVRTTGPIVIDGDLSDAGWKGVAPIETWFETNPGDNVAPSVKTVGW